MWKSTRNYKMAGTVQKTNIKRASIYEPRTLNAFKCVSTQLELQHCILCWAAGHRMPRLVLQAKERGVRGGNSQLKSPPNDRTKCKTTMQQRHATRRGKPANSNKQQQIATATTTIRRATTTTTSGSNELSWAHCWLAWRIIFNFCSHNEAIY